MALNNERGSQILNWRVSVGMKRKEETQKIHVFNKIDRT